MRNVSVVIPTRNRPYFLERALQSMQRQSGNSILECIVVDDGEESGAAECRKIVENTGGIYYLNRYGRSSGGAHARNTGIMAAQGEFVAFLDDDDEWNDGKVSKQMPLMLDEQLDISYTGMFIRNKKYVQRYSFRAPPFSDYYRAIMRRNFIGTTSTVVVRTAAIRNIGGFDNGLPALQDYDLYIRMLKNHKLGWISEPLTTYNAHATDVQVSGSRARFIVAVEQMKKKYYQDPYFPLLKRSFMEITLLKCVRSRAFFLEILRSVFTK